MHGRHAFARRICPYMTFSLHEYQQEAVRFAFRSFRANGGAGLFLDMGLGKTLSSIAIMDIAHRLDPSLRFLVVAPLLPAWQTWPDELEKFGDLHSLDFSVACGRRMTAKRRMKAIDAGATVTIINRENLSWLDDAMPRKWPWRALVIDELSSYKSANTKSFRVLKRHRGGFDWVLGLTGTPAPKGLLDLYSELYLIDGGQALGSTLTSYRNRWFHATRWSGDMVIEREPNPGAYREIMDAISPSCLTMLARDKLPNLPRTVVVDRMLDMPGTTRDAYDEFRREMVVDLGDGDVSAANAAVLTNKLTQFTAGCLYPDAQENPDGEVVHLDDAKLDELARVIEENPGDPVLVFYQFQDELRRLRERWPDLKTVKDAGVSEAWNAGDVPLLVAHPESAKYGLNLQKGGHIVVWLTLTWSAESYAQSNARLARQGQERPVQIVRLIERESVDERKRDVLAGRAALESAVMEELKR